MRDTVLSNHDLVPLAIDVARSEGCEYAEARLHSTSDVTCLTRNGEPAPAMIAEASGIGVRVLFRGALAFGAAKGIRPVRSESVKSLVNRLIRNARAVSLAASEKITFSKEEAHVEKWSSEEKRKVEDVSIESIISYLKEVDRYLSLPVRDVTFPNRNLFLGYNIEEKYFENSDGSKLESRVTRASYLGILVAMYEGKPSSISVPPGYSGLGGSGGWEVIENLSLHETLPAMLKEMTLGIKATAKPPKDEQLDVILGPNVAGLTSHESCGHPGEADRILGREGAQAGESFLKADKLGMQIGSPEAFVSDDPTIPHSMGFYLYDDEGVKAGKRRLITAGRFTEFLQNRATAHRFGIKSNGSSRAVQFDREPIIRMGNTFIEPGDWTFEEMLRDVKRGIYIKNFMEWNIDDKRLNQRYVGLEAYLIKNGNLKEAIKDPVFEITTPKYWGSIDARAKDIQYSCGTCGKGDPMQGAPVFFGAPHIRLRNVRVGAR
ncbi:MAG: TldD/PmbA family protein [Thaumarchaeota archaeon]|nr:TldD/PmbA family protein [Nitrososphaerota archaeon]